MNVDNLCMGCMTDKGDVQVCPKCKWEETTQPLAPSQLPPRTILNGNFVVGRVLGQGGFGITYLGWDMKLERKVAIKEYFPNNFATRTNDGITVTVFGDKAEKNFQYGLKKFLEEGKNLAKFQEHPGIVSTVTFFESNDTAYLVMEYVAGITFKQYLDQEGGKIPFNLTLNILMPVMDALRAVHKSGLLHRDISPDNIYFTEKNQVKLLDFGSARYFAGEKVKTITVQLKDGYAPEEQYRKKGNQGTWTDVYALGATFYRAITGRVPPQALDRLDQDDLIPPSKLGVEIPPPQETVLLKSLALRAPDRFRTVEEFQDNLIANMKEAPPLQGNQIINFPAKKIKEEWKSLGKKPEIIQRVNLLNKLRVLSPDDYFIPLWEDTINQFDDKKKQRDIQGDKNLQKQKITPKKVPKQPPAKQPSFPEPQPAPSPSPPGPQKNWIRSGNIPAIFSSKKLKLVMIFGVIITVSIALILFYVIGAQREAQYKKHFKRAQQSFQEGNFEPMIGHIEQAKKFKKTEELKELENKYNRYKKHYDRARQDFQKGDITSMLKHIELAKQVKETEELKELKNKLPRHIKNIIGKAKKISKNSQGLWEAVFAYDIKIVFIPPGKFMMGSPADEIGRGADEEPQHEVKINNGFWMGKYEVTIAQYLAFCREKDANYPEWLEPGYKKEIEMGYKDYNRRFVSGKPDDTRPIVGISWNDAVAYCDWLSTKTASKFRLPSESEWEYTCRSGTTTPFHYGQSLSSQQANFDGNYPYGGANRGIYKSKTLKVGSFNPNSRGIYDMHGNVFEWCHDTYNSDIYKYPDIYTLNSSGNPVYIGNGSGKSVRGGSWANKAAACRSANRYKYPGQHRSNSLGFRLAMTK